MSSSAFTSLDEAQQAALIEATDAAIAAREQEEAELRESERIAASLEAELRESERVAAAKVTIKELQDRIAQIQLAIPSTTEADVILSMGKASGTPDVPRSDIPAHIRDTPSLAVSSATTPAQQSLRPISNFHDLIGVGDFLSTERSEVELEHSSMQVISKSDRLKLSASDKSKLYANFIKGSTNKFKASSTIVGLEEISTIQNITSFAELRLELQKHVTSISVHPVFLILKFDDEGKLIDPDSPDGAPVNLLSVNTMPPLSDVERSTLFHYKRGSAFNQENLVWSFEAIRNSCDKDLQTIIDAKMLKYKVSERFGPLYYYELVQQMTDVDSKAVRAITQELTALKIPDLEGQSIANAASTIRSTVIWLQMVNMVPPDIDAIVYDILETCTVPDFQLYLKTLSTNASLNNLKLTHNILLEKAEAHYRTLIIARKWDSAGSHGSSFQAQQHRAQRSTTSSGTGENTSANTSRAPRYNMPVWNRTAPTNDEPHERTFEDKIFKWCGICQRWFFGDRAHLTSEHVQGHTTSRRGRTTPGSATIPSTNNAANASILPSLNMVTSAQISTLDMSTAFEPSTTTRSYLFTGGL